MPLNVVDTYHGAVITISGKFLGSREGHVLKEALDAMKESGRTNVVIDLSNTEFMDSSAIGALISGLATMRKVGGDLRLANMDGRVRNVFRTTRLLGPVFKNYASVDDALKSFQQNPPAQTLEA